MFDREQLFNISELNLVGNVTEFGDEFDAFCTLVDEFIDAYAKKEEELKKHLAANDYGSLAKSLSETSDLLTLVHADDLATDCQRQINRLQKGDVDFDDALDRLTAFLTKATALSIDMQLASLEKKGEAPADAAAEGAAGEAKPAEEALPPKPPKPKIAGLVDESGDEEKEDNRPGILAVDDSAFFLTALKAHMQGTPYKLVCLNSGAAAMDYLADANESPVMFILDIEMPYMNGFELAKKIKAAKHMAPVLFLTSSAHRDSVIKAVEVGAADFIVKPVDRQILMEKLEKNIKKS